MLILVTELPRRVAVKHVSNEKPQLERGSLRVAGRVIDHVCGSKGRLEDI